MKKLKDYTDLNDYEIIYMVGEKDEIARNLMYEKYSPLIKKEARRLYKYGKTLGLGKEDLEQEGYIALLSALDNYNPNKNVLFYTYVSAAIRRKMQNLIRSGLSQKHQILNSSISLDQEINEEGTNLFSFIEDKDTLTPLEELEIKENINRLKYILYDLPIIEASILELKMNNFKMYEISELLGISATTIRNINSKIKKNLNLIIEK